MQKETMKILITGAHPSGNKGAEAMLEVLVDQIHKKNSDVEFIFETLSGKEDYSSFENKGINFSTSMFQAKNLFQPFINTVKDVHYVIDIGGLAYTDKSVRDNLRSFVKHFGLIIRGEKLIFFTQDFGPAKKLTTKILGGLVMKFSYKLFTRSKITKDTLLNDFGVKNHKIEGPFPDSTLLFKNETVENITKEKNYIIITPSAILYNKHGEEYIDFLKKIIDYFPKDKKIFILVHCFTKNGNTSDLEISKKLLTGEKNVELISENISSIYLKKIISDASFVITSRYHVLVGAVSTNVPAIAIGWNEKYQSFLDLYDMSEMSVEFNGNTFENTVKLIDNNIENINLKKKLIEKNTILYHEVKDSFVRLSRSLNI